MNRLLKSAIIGLTLTAAAMPAVSPASAGDYYRGHHRHGHYNNGDALAAGAAGLVIGALIAGASQPTYYRNDPEYLEPIPAERVYSNRGPRVVYARGSLEPWTRDWFDYCSDRYRSFNPRTGTYMGYDGQRHFCTAN